jgi:hypothetical protein
MLKQKFIITSRSDSQTVFDKIMNIKGAITKNDSSVYGQDKMSAYINKICLQKIDNSTIEMSEGFGQKGVMEIIGECTLIKSCGDSTIVELEIVTGYIINIILFITSISLLFISTIIVLGKSLSFAPGLSIPGEIIYIGYPFGVFLLFMITMRRCRARDFFKAINSEIF